DRAISFCESTLRFGRAEEPAPRRELMELRRLVEEVGEGLGVPREGLAWNIDIDSVLKVDADREHMFRILNNLCRNAVQALDAQGPSRPGEILIRAWREGGHVLIEVRDTGPGLPQHTKLHLFQAFQGSSRNGGAGLGLAIAAELAGVHGGSLTL